MIDDTWPTIMEILAGERYELVRCVKPFRDPRCPYRWVTPGEVLWLDGAHFRFWRMWVEPCGPVLEL